MFILPANGRRDERVTAVREWIARSNNDVFWRDGPVKILVIVHRMAAKRLGFDKLYAALNDKAPASFKDGFLDASCWLLRPFVSFILPLADAIANNGEFKAMTILRTSSPLLAREGLSKTGVSAVLANLREASLQLSSMLAQGSAATSRQVLQHIRDRHLMTLDPRIISYLDAGTPTQTDQVLEQDQEEVSREVMQTDGPDFAKR